MSKYEIKLVDSSEFIGLRRGKWATLCGQMMKQIKELPQGKSARIDFPDLIEARSFRVAMRNMVANRRMNKKFVVGQAKGEPIVFVGRK